MHGSGGRESQVLADMGDTPAEEEERGPGGTRSDGIWNPFIAVKEIPRVGIPGCCDWGGPSLRVVGRPVTVSRRVLKRTWLARFVETGHEAT